MRNEASCGHAIAIIGSKISREVKSMASSKTDSTMMLKTKECLKSFEWDKFLNEISGRAPILFKILMAATKTRSVRSNQLKVIGMCVAMILKHRNPNLNLLQKMISLILYSGHCSKQVSCS